MGKKSSFIFDDGRNELVKRYENYLSGLSSGYFDVEEIGLIVDYYLQRGKTIESQKALDFGKKLHPESSLLDVKKAKYYLMTNEPQKAIALLNNQLDDDDLEIANLKIEALTKLSQDKKALELAMDFLDNEFDDEYEMMCLDFAAIFMTENAFDAALKTLERGEHLFPENIDILLEKAFCYEQMEEESKAIKVYEQIIDIDAYSSEAWFNLAQVYFNKNEYVKALEAYDYALVINEEDTISLMQKGHILFQLNRFKEAIDVYLEYLKNSSEKWNVYVFIGECYEKMEQFAQSLYYYKLSLDEMPNNYDALVGVTICSLELGEYAEGLKHVNQALELDDRAADLWVYYAEAQIGLNNIDEALNAYLKSLSINSSQPDILMSVASIYMDNGNYKDALKYYESAYSFDNDIDLIELFLAVAYCYNKDEANMEKFYRLAIQKSLDSIDIFNEFCPNQNINP